jgi:hypothetical protein
MDQISHNVPNDQKNSELSATRLRAGVLLLFIWWIPFWLLEPVIDKIFGVTSSTSKHDVLIAILAIQTVLGLVGILIAGKQVWTIFRKTSRRQLPRSVWHMLRHGEIE